jgi:hypothetical protein
MPVADLAARRLTPELLDQMVPDDPAALRSRVDLGRINAIMGQARSMSGLLRRARAASPVQILDIGAGDGAFMLEVARRLGPEWRGSTAVLLDRLPGLVDDRRRQEFERLGWVAHTICADARLYLASEAPARFDIVTANLVLHHFDVGALSTLLASIAAAADVFASCEPRRSRLAIAGTRMLWAIAANAVTRHDARVSVEAGFRDRDLTELWPSPSDWDLWEQPKWPFTHMFLATRRAPS